MPKINQFIHQKFTKNRQLVDKLTTELQLCIPPSYLDHCRCVGINDNTLVLSTSTPAWMSKLRFYKADIIKHFKHQLGYKVKYLKFIVTPAQKLSQPNTHKARTLSQNAAQQIHSLAEHVADPQLRQSLMQLAKRVRPSRS